MLQWHPLANDLHPVRLDPPRVEANASRARQRAPAENYKTSSVHDAKLVVVQRTTRRAARGPVALRALPSTTMELQCAVTTGTFAGVPSAQTIAHFRRVPTNARHAPVSFRPTLVRRGLHNALRGQRPRRADVGDACVHGPNADRRDGPRTGTGRDGGCARRAGRRSRSITFRHGSGWGRANCARWE